jgi:hypothetical protein
MRPEHIEHGAHAFVSFLRQLNPNTGEFDHDALALWHSAYGPSNPDEVQAMFLGAAGVAMQLARAVAELENSSVKDVLAEVEHRLL